MIHRDLDILLLSMPVRVIDRPSLSLPVLTAHLKKHGINVQQIDENMVLQDQLLDETELEKLHSNILPLLIRLNQNNSKVYGQIKTFYELLDRVKNNVGFARLAQIKKQMQIRDYERLLDRNVVNIVEDIFTISSYLAFYFTTVTYYRDYYHKNLIGETVAAEIDKLIDAIVEANPLMVGFSLMEVQRNFTIWCGGLLRQKYQGSIVFGGSEPSLNKQKYMEENPYIDYLCWADGEDTLTELIKQIKNHGTDFSYIPNLTFRENGKLVTNHHQEYPIHQYNYPDYEGYPLDLYIFPALQILTSKGCEWSKCKFCMHWNSYGARFRQRDAKDVAEEMAYFNKKYGTSLFSVVDEAISAKFGRNLADEIIKKELDVRWIQMSRLDSDFDDSVFQKIHQGGCRVIEWGLETGSQRVLNDMSKGIDIRTVQRLIHQSGNAGIINKMLMFHNYPIENADDLMKSINIIKKNTYFHLIKPMLTLRHAFVLKLGSPLADIAFGNSEEKSRYFYKVWKPESIYNVNAKYISSTRDNNIKQNLINDYLREMRSYLKSNNVLITDNNNITMDLVLVDLIEKGYSLPVDVYLPRDEGGIGSYLSIG